MGYRDRAHRGRSEGGKLGGAWGSGQGNLPSGLLLDARHQPASVRPQPVERQLAASATAFPPGIGAYFLLFLPEFAP